MKNPNYIPQEEFERIEEYILGIVSPEEIDAFESEMKKNADLRQKYLEVKKIIVGIEEAALRDNLEIFHQEMDSENKGNTVGQDFNVWPWAAAAAILLCIAAAVWTLYTPTPSHEKLFAQFYQEDPGLITAMSSESNYEFDRAMVDYKSGKYQEAVDRWEKLIRDKPDNDTLHYFLGASLQAMNLNEDAIPFFQKVIEEESKRFSEDAQWYLGLSFLKMGEMEKATYAISASEHPDKEKLLLALSEK